MKTGDRKVILAGTLIDGTGAVPLKGAVITVEDGRFASIETGGRPDAGPETEVLDLRDRFVLPGLIDSHCHFFHMFRNYYEDNTVGFTAKAIRNAGTWLEMGVTTVREVGTRENLDLGLRDAINAGVVRGSRIFASGTALCATGGGPVVDAPRRFVIEVTGADEARRVARQQLRAGADLIKLFTTAGAPSGLAEMTVEEIRAASEEAHKAGKHVAAHAMSLEGIMNCIEGGVDTIEHGNGIDQRAADLMAERGMFLVPTLAITNSMAAPGGRWNTPPDVASFAQKAIPELMAGIRMARDAGVKIAVGTDPPRLDTPPMEAAVLVQAGLTPMEAIVGATLRGAEILGRTELLGTVRVGRYADLSAFDADPLTDINVLQAASFVMKDGDVVVDRRRPTAGARS